jgi:hypothetical protein
MSGTQAPQPHAGITDGPGITTEHARRALEAIRFADDGARRRAYIGLLRVINRRGH